MSFASVRPLSSILFMQPLSRLVTLSVSMKSPLNCTIVWPWYIQGISSPLCAEFCSEYPAKVQYSFMALPSSTGVAISKKPYLSSLPSSLDLYLTARKSALSAEMASQLPYLQKTRLMEMLKATPDWLRQRMNSQVWNLSKTASTDSSSLAVEEREAKVCTTVAYEGIWMWLYPNLAMRLMFCALLTCRLGIWVTLRLPSSSLYSQRSRQMVKLVRQMLDVHSVTTIEKRISVIGEASSVLLKVRSIEQILLWMSQWSIWSSQINCSRSQTYHRAIRQAVSDVYITMISFFIISLGSESVQKLRSDSATTKVLYEAVETSERQKALLQSSQTRSQRAMISYQRLKGTACKQLPPVVVSRVVCSSPNVALLSSAIGHTE